MTRASFMVIATVATAACASPRGPASEAKPAAQAPMAGMPMPGESGSDSGSVAIDRTAAARAGITFARAALRPLGTGMLLAGTLGYPETSRRVVTVRVNGWVQQLFADYTGKAVHAGDPLFTLYSPDVVGVEEEYLTARRLRDSSLMLAARQRLDLLDVPAAQIMVLDTAHNAPRLMTVRASSSGEVAAKMITAGQAVRSGDSLLVLADRGTLWLNVVVHEMDAAAITLGSRVTITVRSLPDRHWTGRVAFILPTADSATRTLTARVEVSNADGALRPGMYASIEVALDGTPKLSVPVTAVLPTGERDLVFINRGNDRFEPRVVHVGARSDSLVEILSGLNPGDEVIASATYLIDSESNLAAAMQGLMLQMGMRANEGQPGPAGKDRVP